MRDQVQGHSHLRQKMHPQGQGARLKLATLVAGTSCSFCAGRMMWSIPEGRCSACRHPGTEMFLRELSRVLLSQTGMMTRMGLTMLLCQVRPMRDDARSHVACIGRAAGYFAHCCAVDMLTEEGGRRLAAGACSAHGLAAGSAEQGRAMRLKLTTRHCVLLQ